MKTTQHLQKGLAKLNKRDQVLPNRPVETGARRVQVDSKTWIYVNNDLSDAEAIARYRERYGL